MTPMPVIINNRHTREVNCIVEQGVRYCEKEPNMTAREAGLGFILVVLWLVAILHVLTEWDNPLLGLALFLMPFILMVIFGG